MFLLFQSFALSLFYKLLVHLYEFILVIMNLYLFQNKIYDLCNSCKFSFYDFVHFTCMGSLRCRFPCLLLVNCSFCRHLSRKIQLDDRFYV